MTKTYIVRGKIMVEKIVIDPKNVKKTKLVS